MAYFELQQDHRALGPRRLAMLVLAIACLSASAVVFKSAPEDWSAFNWRAVVNGAAQIWHRLVDGAQQSINIDRIAPAASTLLDNIEETLPIPLGADAANGRRGYAAPVPAPCVEHVGRRRQCGCIPWSSWEPDGAEICPTPIAQELNNGRSDDPVGPSSSTTDAIDAYLAEHPDEDVHASFSNFGFGDNPPPLYLGVGSLPKPPKPPIVPGVPEPGAWVLLVAGCCLLGLALRPSWRKPRANAAAEIEAQG